MSRTTVKIIESDGTFKDIAELQNSWGSAAFVWSALSEKYFGKEIIFGLERDPQRLWNLVNDERLSLAERIVHASTFDHAIVEYEHFADAAKLFREFSREHATVDSENHMPAIADLLDEWKDKPCIGMCFQQTSVSEDPWHGAWNEEKEDYEPYDIHTNKKHFFVFAKYGAREVVNV